MNCPICEKSNFIDYLKGPLYKICLNCNLFIQKSIESQDQLTPLKGFEENNPVRIPVVDVSGIEYNSSCIHSIQSVYMLAVKLGYEIAKCDKLEGTGQADFYVRKKKDHPTISFCMIVKNEAANITDCLESIKDIADEIIVVDTGSTDDTKKVVSKYTNKIYDFNWIDDFSAARNFSLSKAFCDWICWIDADDILLNPKDLVPLLKGSYDVHNFNVFYCGESFCHARLFRNFKGIKFLDPVHEYPVIDGLSFQAFPVINILHKSEKQCTENRSERNYRILEKEVKGNPKNSRALFYLANALRELGRYEEAVLVYAQYVSISTWNDEKWMAYKYMGKIFQGLKKYLEAIGIFKRAIQIDDRWAESYYYAGECCFLLKKYEECIEWMLKAIRPIPSSPMFKETMIYQDAPYKYIFASYESLENYEKALEYCKKALEIKPDPWLNERCIYFQNKLVNKVQVIECFRQGALGDCLMTTSALKGLKKKYPGCFIRYVTHPDSMKILEGNRCIDELTDASKDDSEQKIYFCYPNKDSILGDEGYPNKPLNRHLVKIFNECAGIFDIPDSMECPLSDEDEKIGKDLKNQYGSYVTIHIKSGWSSYKDWYNDRWEFVVEELFKKGFVTIQIGLESDPLLRNVVDFRGHAIKGAISAIKHARVHVGIDSFSNHASVAVGTPAVILFGSTSPTGSGYDSNINLYKSLPCQPCYIEYEWSKDSKFTCPFNKNCMNLITSEEVLSSVLSLLRS